MNIEKRSMVSGLLYMALIVPGIFAFLVIPEMLMSEGNINQYVQNHLGVVVLWLLLDLIIIVIEIYLTIYLKIIFDRHNKTLSFIAFLTRFMIVLIMLVNVVFLFIILFYGGTNAEQFINLHIFLTYTWQLFFSIHVFLLGLMLLKYLQTIWQYLGYILLLGAIGYFLDSIEFFINEDYAFLTTMTSILLIFVTIGEIGMAIALLKKKTL